MSSQRSLDSYFKKTKESGPVPVNKMDNKNKFKRRSLSLTKAPHQNKSSKTVSESCEVASENEVICLSDDSSNLSCSQRSTHSESSTIIMSPSAYQTPPKTPTKAQKSAGSTKEFYSPIKKRIVKASPAKRNLLASQFKENQSEAFKDDKTIFLLSLIKKYLSDDTLNHLLDEDSLVLLSNCIHVGEPGLRTVCRLFWRQLRWYTVEELTQIVNKNKEHGQVSISDTSTMLKSLTDKQLIISSQCEGTNIQFEECLNLIKRDKIIEICKEFLIKVQNKKEAEAQLKKLYQRRSLSAYGFGSLSQKSDIQHRLLKRLQLVLGQNYKLSDGLHTALNKLYIIMYLGIDYSIIRDKKLELLLLTEKSGTETYPIDKDMVLDNASIVFQNKEEFNRYYDAHLMYEKYVTTIENKKIVKDNINVCTLILKAYKLYKEIEESEMTRYKSLPSWLRRFTRANIYLKIMESGVQELKKDGSTTDAVNILNSLIAQTTFRQHKRAQWYEEKALILHRHLKSADEAANTLLEAFSSDLSEEAKGLLRLRAKMIANQRNITLDEGIRDALRDHAKRDFVPECEIPADHVHKPPMDNYNQTGKLKFIANTDSGKLIMSAEEYCIMHYVQSGEFTHGEHCEGRIITSIFFLLFWDIIYTKPLGVTGVFMSYYQQYPLDMYSECFYINRKNSIDERLAFIEECTDDMLEEMMKNTWYGRPPSEVSALSRSVDIEWLCAAARGAGARALAAVCRRLARNYGYASSGFPDLTLWNDNTKKVKFVEVKTDADKPSVKQLQWLDYLISHDIPAGFCYVGVHTTRSKARARDTTS